MPQKRRIYDDEFKRDAVRLVTHNSYGVSETADRLGISAKLLGRWKREAETRANGVFNGPVQVSPGPDELNQLRKENQRLRMERYTKKNGRLLRERIELRHAFIAAHQGQWPVAVLCEVLGVSRSGFYDYQSRQDHPKIDAEEVALLAQVKAIAVATRSSYGSRRMAKALQAKGFAVGRAKARRLMNEAGVQVRRAKRRAPVTTDSRHGYEVAPNLLARHFDVDAPDLAWGGDITYVWTAEGWLYVSTLLDLYSRKGVGWAMSSRINTQLVQDA